MSSLNGRSPSLPAARRGLARPSRALRRCGRGGIVIVGRGLDKGQRVAAEITAATGVPVEMVATDLGLVADVQAVIPATDRRFGRVDILVNAAGLTDRGNL